MSKFMYIGLKKRLENVEIFKEEIFKTPDIYKNNLWFSDGLLFDDKIDNEIQKRLTELGKNFNWYCIKGFINPLEAEVKTAEDFPDLYEASLQMSKWFIKFIKNIVKENEVLLINLWIGSKPSRKIEVKTLDLNEIDIKDYHLPLDVLFKLKV